MSISKNPDNIILEYIWIDGIGELRSKYRTVPMGEELSIDKWNYDGSSTYQADTENSEIVLNPVAFYPNPFFEEGRSLLVLCDTYTTNDQGTYKPTLTNRRVYANEIFNKALDKKPWFGIEQEYFMMSPCETLASYTPFAMAGRLTPKQQGDYYCGVGNQHVQFRALAEKHYLYCLKAGLKISGINAEVAPNQWEFQIGPCEGISAGDQLWVARYILHKLSEEFGVNICFKPKPLSNPWNGSGLHTNFSTLDTRADGGLEVIYQYMKLLEPKHMEHIAIYGDNSERLNGTCETSQIDKFSWNAGHRGCSIRIPRSVLQDRKGYFEDRRPASNADPYQVIGILFQTCCLQANRE